VLEFFFFILILLGGFWGFTMLYYVAKALSKRLETPEPGPADVLLREEVENLAGRLARVEDELDFYRQLKAPDDPDVSIASEVPETLELTDASESKKEPSS
jgi:hypothetical protein